MFAGFFFHVMVKSSFFLYIDSQMYDDIVKPRTAMAGSIAVLGHLAESYPVDLPMKSGEIHIVSPVKAWASLRCSHGCRWHGTFERRRPGFCKKAAMDKPQKPQKPIKKNGEKSPAIKTHLPAIYQLFTSYLPAMDTLSIIIGLSHLPAIKKHLWLML